MRPGRALRENRFPAADAEGAGGEEDECQSNDTKSGDAGDIE